MSFLVVCYFSEIFLDVELMELSGTNVELESSRRPAKRRFIFASSFFPPTLKLALLYRKVNRNFSSRSTRKSNANPSTAQEHKLACVVGGSSSLYNRDILTYFDSPKANAQPRQDGALDGENRGVEEEEETLPVDDIEAKSS